MGQRLGGVDPWSLTALVRLYLASRHVHELARRLVTRDPKAPARGVSR